MALRICKSAAKVGTHNNNFAILLNERDTCWARLNHLTTVDTTCNATFSDYYIFCRLHVFVTSYILTFMFLFVLVCL